MASAVALAGAVLSAWMAPIATWASTASHWVADDSISPSGEDAVVLGLSRLVRSVTEGST